MSNPPPSLAGFAAALADTACHLHDAALATATWPEEAADDVLEAIAVAVEALLRAYAEPPIELLALARVAKAASGASAGRPEGRQRPVRAGESALVGRPGKRRRGLGPGWSGLPF